MECFRVSVSVLVLGNTFNSSNWVLEVSVKFGISVTLIVLDYCLIVKHYFEPRQCDIVCIHAYVHV